MKIRKKENKGKNREKKRSKVKAVVTIAMVSFFLASLVNIEIGFGIKSVEASPDGGDILYVGGIGPNNYTKIQDAIDDADDGDTVFVFNGIYYENVVISTSINLIGEDKNTTIIEGEYSNHIVMVTADWVDISGFKITNSIFPYYGVKVDQSNHVKFHDNICDGNYVGIGFGGGSNNSIFKNICKNNINTYPKGHGIHLTSYSNNNEIRDNICENNGYGISLGEGANNNKFFDNVCSNNDIGIYFDNIPFDNIIYHNNLIDNIQNADDDGTNTWDNGFEGNYWSDYIGNDGDGDGIGDTPYYIPSGSNRDNYPLMTPYSNGLVACWHFDEGSGSIAYDSSDNDNDGIIHGATWTTGVSGKALSFDGVNDYVEVSDDDSLDITDAISIEAWIYRKSASDDA
ncbi:MAG: right-handed parallel beta-helix repeat-containing protein, partial [Thermoplasmatales archaeon]|nr:right-handed parallel beta-helix repeat-containing protein [Thermoplasmatales archaeon]